MILEEALKQIHSSLSGTLLGYVILDKYHTRIPRKEKKRIKKRFKI